MLPDQRLQLGILLITQTTPAGFYVSPVAQWIIGAMVVAPLAILIKTMIDYTVGKFKTIDALSVEVACIKENYITKAELDKCVRTSIIETIDLANSIIIRKPEGSHDTK